MFVSSGIGNVTVFARGRGSRAPGRCHVRMRRGVTVVEVLLAVGLISLLLALVLPGLQSARESARKSQCLNNLRQLGVASHNHVASFREFPYTSSSPGRALPANLFPNRETRTFQLAASPLATMSASIEQALYDRIDFGDRWLTDLSQPLGAVSEINRPLLNLNVAIFRCPSDRYQPGANNYRANCGIGLRNWRTRKDAGCTSDDRNGRGAFCLAQAIRPAAFTDGLSVTALFSEKVIGDFDPTEMTPFRDRFQWPGDETQCSIDEFVALCQSHVPVDAAHMSYGGSNWLIGGMNATWYNHLLGPNSVVPDCSIGNNIAAGGGPGVYSARSLHPQGVNVLFADGAVSSVNDTVDIRVWHAMGTRDYGD